MARLSRRFAAGAALLASTFACSEPDPVATPPRAVKAIGETTLTGTVGQAVTGGITVRVIDYSSRGKPDVKVGFSVVGGDGSVSERLVVTDGDGVAHTEWTLGQTAGENRIIASVYGIDADSNATFVATGNPAAASSMSVTPKTLRIPSTSGVGAVAARLVDNFGNVVTSSAPTFVSRNEAVVTVNASGQVTVTNNNRGTSTWIVATAGGFSDSTHVFNLAVTDPPCTGITAMAALNVGEVRTTGFVDNGVCVPAAAGEREYAIVPFFDTPVPSAQTVFTVTGVGIKGTTSGVLGSLRPPETITAAMRSSAAEAETRMALDRRLRQAERREMTTRAAGARQWHSTRFADRSLRANLAAVVPSVGEQIQLNVNADDFCANPDMRTGRVVAVTERAVVVADMSNPAGYSDADYQSFGLMFDTLAYPTNVTNFGAPTDIDNNGNRTIVFFTHGVNDIGPGVLGFAYARDLLPKDGPLGSCPGSNFGEIVNVRVPNASLSVASARTDVVGTLAHELQHVINSARRLYVNPAAAPVEEVWLNEGLSHIAEELVFYRSSGLAPRQNLGLSLATTYNAPYTSFQRRNFDRYFVFTRNPGTQGPVGLNDIDDDIATRGAIWSFLRFAADQRFGGNETAFWQSMANSNSTGMQNLYDHIGTDARLLMRDWAISNFMDDLVPTEAKYTQPSWNLRQVPGFQPPVTFAMTSQTTPTTATSQVTLRSLSSEFVRFAVGANQEAYISAAGFPASANTPLPRSVLLAIVRTK